MNPLEGMALFNVFCDDVRTEEDGRNTYVGCYPSSTVVLDGQTQLPRLSGLIVLKGPATTNLQNAELVLRHSGFPGDDMALPFSATPIQNKNGDTKNNVPLEEQMLVFRAIVQLSGISVWPGVKINSVLRQNGVEVRGNPLFFTGAPTSKDDAEVSKTDLETDSEKTA